MSQAKLQKTFWRVLPASALFCLFQHSLRADVTATILGIARDSSGSVLPDVKVTVSNVETNLSRSALTDTTGEFRFLSLPVGTYTVQAELSGFQTFVAANIVLTFDQQHRIDATLQVGNLQQRVEVSAAAVQWKATNPGDCRCPMRSLQPRPDR